MTVPAVNSQLAVTRRKSGLDLQLSSAVAVGKLTILASRRLGLGGGTALPGVLASRLDPAILAKLAAGRPRGNTLVTGTNGKTTTSRLLAAILDRSGWTPVHNRAGANLSSGVTTALLDKSDLFGRPAGDSGLFEVDEAVMPRLLAATQPRVVILTNLFRDQLDRYGEIDFVAGLWRDAVQALSPETMLVLNADDPGVAVLARRTAARVLFYGVEAAPTPEATLGHVADSKNCPICGTPLRYRAVCYAHVGRYACPTGDFARPTPDVVATDLSVQGVDASQVTVRGPFGQRAWRFQLPGLYNAYNLLAAVAGAVALGAPIEAIDGAVAGFSAAFGRLERIRVGNRTLFFALVKNPVGFTEVVRTVLSQPGDQHLAIAINDNLADGTDVSWLWDADVEALASRCQRVTVSGTRGGDMAVRLKYAGLPAERIFQAASLEQALDDGLAAVPEGGTLYVLPTYTAMLGWRKLVSRRGYADRFWES
ncbi:MAG: MurT ligase domain-containing protein [Chloroflexota bacterium]